MLDAAHGSWPPGRFSRWSAAFGACGVTMIAAAGIDSWSPCWYVDRDSAAAGLLGQLAHVPAARGTLIPYAIAGHRVGWNRAAGMLYAEGHPSGAMPGEWSVSHDLLSEHAVVPPDAEPWLVPPAQLPTAYAGLVEALEVSGVPVPASQWAARPQVDGFGLLPDEEGRSGFGGLRRCDATVDVSPSGAGEGLAILAGVAGVATTAPRCQAEVRFAKDGTGAVETVYVRGFSGVKILGRWYDKGLESGCAPRGERIRAEDQRRYPKGHRRGIHELEAHYVRSKFQQRFYPLWQATKGVTVAGPMILADKLAELVDGGELTARQAGQLVGYVVLAKRGVRFSRATTYRRRSELRDAGLVVADGCLQEVEVDLHAVLEEAMESSAWGATG
jgi:hypothetical protein